MKRRIILWISSIMWMLVLCFVLNEMQEMHGKVQAKAEQKKTARSEDDTEDAVTEPEVLYPEPDGTNGYYITCPEIKIVHKEKGWVTRYELSMPDGAKKDGMLQLTDTQEEVSEVLSEMLEEGENILHVWMEAVTEEQEETEERENSEEQEKTEERENSEEQEKTEEKKESEEEENMETDENKTERRFFREISFLIDSTAPESVKFSYHRAETGNILYANEPFEVFLESEDGGSGIAEIYYKMDDGTSGTITGKRGSVVLDPGFSGKLEAYSVDRAGNQSEKCDSKTILCENISPMIQIQIEEEEKTWHSTPVSVDVEVWDPQLSAGIQSFKCYCDGKVIVQKMGEPDEISLSQMSTHFIVDTAAKGGQGVPVVVEVVDWAGNFQTESRLICYDGTAPDIYLKGARDGLIMGQKIDAVVTAEDDNFLASCRFELWRTAPDGTRERIGEKTEHAEGLTENRECEWNAVMEEDGIYEMIAEAEDCAGNRTEKCFRIVVDKTSPVIRYVNQMQGVHIPYFEWNYRAGDMVEEFTEYTFEILLNGFPYSAGTKIYEEGIKSLQVRAVDAVGNESSAEAVFLIDHTPPYINIYGIEDGGVYDKEAELSVSVDGNGEFLKEITVNGERMKLENTGQIFQRSFTEQGDYEICILAEDLAGNQSEKRFRFSVEDKKVSAAKIVHSIEKILKNEPASESLSETAEGERHNYVWWLMTAFIGAGALILYFRKKNP